MVEETIDPCCGCMKLRTGCLIIGYFRLVVEITLGSYLALITIPSWVEGVTGGFKYFMIILSVLILLSLTMSIIACILFLVGLHKNQRESVAGYIKHARGCIVMTVIFCARRLIWPTSTQDFTSFRIGFVLLLLQCFFLVVIGCYCESIDEKPQPETTAAAPAPVPEPVLALVPAPVPHK